MADNNVNSQITFNEISVVTNDTQVNVTQPVTNVIEVISFGPQGPGGSSITVQNEGTTLTSGAILFNFIGGGVNATANGDEITINIPGGGQGSDPGGISGQIQYNSASAFAGVPVLTFDGTLLRATGSFSGSFTGRLINQGNLIISGSVVLEPQAIPPPNPYGSIYFDGIDFFLGT